MRNKFDEQLSQLNHEMIEMGALCEEVIALASRALTENDKSLAARVAPLDSEIDRKERDIENLCLKLLLQQQPVASDLRLIRMVTESVDAYVKCDTMLAEQVIAEDDTVDGYFTQVKERLIGKLAQDPADGEYALDLLMIAKYFERIGDHATNIAEWVIFSVTGVHKGG